MKTKTTKTLSADNLIPGATAVPFKSAESITADFIAAEKKKAKSAGENDYIDDLKIALDMIVKNYRDQTWSLNTVIELTRYLDTPVSEIGPKYLLWVDELKKAKAIQQCLTVSSFPNWRFIV